jgi:adenosylmethionine-8-amino-7-oxononanoate aminotransferase
MDRLHQYGTGVPTGRSGNAAYRDITTVLHPNTNLLLLNKAGPRVIERGKGIDLYTADGCEFLDGMAGLWCTALGDGNEELVKLIWYMNNALGRPKGKKIIARVEGFHGLTIGAGSLTDIPLNHRDFDLPIVNVLHASCPHYYRQAHDGESEEEFATRLAAELAHPDKIDELFYRLRRTLDRVLDWATRERPAKS